MGQWDRQHGWLNGVNVQYSMEYVFKINLRVECCLLGEHLLAAYLLLVKALDQENVW